ncbi:hypothetical protein [Aestuariivita boseongensis]|uniref:hypothetical protein n=1 Tax=Aestuariivita boseongensis TaxID=1470562 RepID=UPI000680AAA4|nr:hypothetical protein [Aestuariivita boseongensis]
MAKLKDLAVLIEQMNGGDKARSNSLVMVARKAGLFTTGGRGPNAPEMTPIDFSRALLLGAILYPPTRAAEAVKALEAARFSTAIVEMADGNFPAVLRAGGPIDESEVEEIELPTFLDELPVDLEGLLTLLFSAVFSGRWSFEATDYLLITDTPGRSMVSINLAGQRYGEVVGNRIDEDVRTKDHFNWHFSFDLEKPTTDHELFGEVQRRISSNALLAMQNLARQDNPDA